MSGNVYISEGKNGSSLHFSVYVSYNKMYSAQG